MRSPEVQKRLETEGARFIPTTPAQFAVFQKDELVKWAKIIKDANISRVANNIQEEIDYVTHQNHCAGASRRRIAAATSAHAGSVDEVIKSGVLRACTPGDYKPFSFAKPDGTFEGIDVDLMQSLATSLGVKVEYVKTTWANLLADFTANKCDIAVGGISVTLDRQKRVGFSNAYMVNGKTPLVRCADVKRFQTVADIDKADVKVIANPGGSNERFAKANFKTAKLTIHQDNLGIFDEVLKGNADVFVTESAEAIVQQKQKPGLCAVNPDKPLQYGEMAYILPRGDVLTKEYVDQWLHLSKASGEYQRIVGRWLN